GTNNQAHVFGLEPFTTYDIHVVAFNSAGQVTSPWTSVRTLEASPSGLNNFTVEKRENGRALLLKWSEPLKPNGVIKTYNIFSDDNLEFSGLSRQFHFRRLEPYTVYTLVLEACTNAGCTRSAPQPIRTDEAPPSSQPAPVAQSVNATSIELTWAQPTHPNGKISEYQIIFRNNQGSRLGNAAVVMQEEKILFTEYSTEKDTFLYNVTDLKAWTKYEFKVRSWNTAGYTDSSWIMVETRQAQPKGLAAPRVHHLDDNPHNLFITWTPPEEINGVLQSYRLQRDNITFPFSFDTTTVNYTDEDLMAYTMYSYAIIACTMGGCTTSVPARIRTLETAPSSVGLPRLTTISATEMNISWSAPLIQNGEITKYTLLTNGEQRYTGKGLFSLISNLQPYTEYQFILIVCTNGGCTSSPPASARTHEAPPTNMSAPRLKVTGSESVEVTWEKPTYPNGEVKSYELRRDGDLIYAGLETRYHDFTLMPSIEYAYTVTANNSKGSITSPIATARTNPSAPSGVAPPKLQPSSLSGIFVMWDPPARSNGEITNYTLLRRDPVEAIIITIIFPSYHPSYFSRTYTLSGLKPYYRYEVRIEACTVLGCASSDWASTQTLEAPPANQTAPLIELHTDADGFQLVLLVSWPMPQQPNGKILHFELYRRLVTNPPTSSGLVLIYKGVLTSFRDATLQPFTEYEYQVWSINSVGKVSSSWSRAKTGAAPPEGVPPPTFPTVQATSAVVSISPPTKPNGIVSLYRVFNNSRDKYLLVSYIARIKHYTMNCPFNECLLPFLTVPQYRAPFIVISNLTTVYLDWSYSFILNGQLREYALTENGVRLYSGFDSTLHIPRTSDKTFVFQVTCTTDTGSVSTPIIKYNTATGIGPVETTPGEKTGMQDSDSKFYSELWFIILMAILGLIFLAIILAVVLQRAISKPLLERERTPIVPLQQRMPSMSVYPPSDANMGLADTKIAGPGSHLSNHSNRSMSVLRVPSQTQLSRVYSQNSLHRSISQLIDTHDKSLIEDTVWETIVQGHDSGMFVEDEDLIDSIKGFSKVRKEHTMFTDTHL
ncbi:UNVERIFIED_CONTAM: hypothetical protein FKN15_047159, partial [Acipenser sinensis]